MTDVDASTRDLERQLREAERDAGEWRKLLTMLDVSNTSATALYFMLTGKNPGVIPDVSDATVPPDKTDAI
jgi:hypothetical protein